VCLFWLRFVFRFFLVFLRVSELFLEQKKLFDLLVLISSLIDLIDKISNFDSAQCLFCQKANTDKNNNYE